MKILLICGAGMSTSLLVCRMIDEIQDESLSVKCCDVTVGKLFVKDYDVVLLAPHVEYMKKTYVQLCSEYDIPFGIIDKADYKDMDAIKIYNFARDMFNDYKRERIVRIVLIQPAEGCMSKLLSIDIDKKRDQRENGWEIKTLSEIELFDKEMDVILIEPQIRFIERKLRKIQTFNNSIILVPPMELYLSYDGRKFLNYIHSILVEN